MSQRSGARAKADERVHDAGERIRAIYARARESVVEHPLGAVGAAAALGFVVGGGVTRGVLTVLLGAGARAASLALMEGALGNLSADDEPSDDGY